MHSLISEVYESLDIAPAALEPFHSPGRQLQLRHDMRYLTERGRKVSPKNWRPLRYFYIALLYYTLVRKLYFSTLKNSTRMVFFYKTLSAKLDFVFQIFILIVDHYFIVDQYKYSFEICAQQVSMGL